MKGETTRIVLADGVEGLLAGVGLFDLIESAVAVVDADGSVLYANPAFARFNERVRDRVENVGVRDSLLDCPDIRETVLASLGETVPTTLAGTFFYGRNIPVDMTLLVRPVVVPATDRPVGALLTIAEESVEHDNRHLARLQDRVRELGERVVNLSADKRDADELIRALLKEAPIAVVLFNEKRQLIQMNSAAERLFGTSTRDATGRPCEEFCDCYAVRGACPVLDRQDSLHMEETSGRAGDISSVPLLQSATLHTSIGRTLVLEAFVDLTERYQAEAEIARLNEYNRLLVEATGEGILGLDRQLKCTFANNAAASMLGYAPNEIIGEDIHTLIHHSHEDGTPFERKNLPIYRTIAEDRPQWAEDAVLWQRDGRALPVQYLSNPMRQYGKPTGAVMVFRDVAKARAMARRMDYLATHDSLTGLVNRREFERRLTSALNEAKRDDTMHMLCYMDLDQFKIVNDTCGHTAGDELLRQLTLVITEAVRQSDTVARLGGDEFGLLFHGCSVEHGKSHAERIRRAIEEFRFSWDGKSFQVGASIGLVTVDRGSGSTTEMLSAADSACYVAKDLGRNRIHVYQLHDEDLVRRHGEMEWVTRIREALEHDRLFLCYQPIVPVAVGAGDAPYFEVLVRMRDEHGDMILPGAFMPAAERYNLMTAIDKWVVETALSWLAGGGLSRHGNMLCGINLSGQSVGDEHFLDFVTGCMRKYRVPGELLCFEITETAAVANMSRAMEFMHELRARRCRFALDDFGSGMSSFAYLKNLPVDFLKIDGTFVRDMDTDPVDNTMVAAIHQVGHVMGIRTVAEFVESPAILEQLRDVGVDFAQGFGIARPRCLSEFRPVTGDQHD